MQSEIERLLNENKLLKENHQKYIFLNNSFSEMLRLNDLKSIYNYIATSLQKFYPNSVILCISINEKSKETKLESLNGLDKNLLVKSIKATGFNFIGKKYKLLPAFKDFLKSGKLVEFKGGLTGFLPSEFQKNIAHKIENIIGLNKIYTIGILKDDVLLGAVHFLTINKNTIEDYEFIETFINQAGIIIEKEIIEIELQESQEHFKKLSELTFEGIIIHNNGVVIEVNDAMLRISGYSKNELLGKNITELMVLPEFQDLVKDNTINKKTNQYQVIAKRKDGTIFNAEVQEKNILYNKLELRMSAVRDITERIEEEKKLKESEEHYKTLANLTYEGIIIHNNGVVVEVNDSFLKISGYEKNEIIGKNVIPLMILPKFHALTKQKMIEEYTKPYRIEGKKKDGTLLNIELESKNIILNNISYRITAVRDITERIKTEEIIKNKTKELEKLNSDKDRFIQILAHDLSNPFNSLIGFSDMLKENYENFDKKTLEEMIYSINNISHLTYDLLQDILLWTKSQSGKLPFEPQKLELIEISKIIIEQIKYQAQIKNIEIDVSNLKETDIFADENMLKTVLRNLISNAIKFTPKNGKINISSQIINNFVEIKVSDTGIGISKENQKKLWNFAKPFTSKGTENEKGTGLGLILCKEFLEKHNGKIWLESQEGKGSDFIFTLPLFFE